MNDFAAEIISYYEEKCEKVNNGNVNKYCKGQEKGLHLRSAQKNGSY